MPRDTDLSWTAGPTTAAPFSRRVYLAAPVEVVWPWLVEPELSQQYHPGNLLTRPEAVGDPLQYANKIGWHLAIDGEVLEIVEGRRLVHTFQFQTEFPDPPSRVTYELLRYGDAMCCLDLRHEELDTASETFKGISTSWDIILSSLKTLVETGKPLPWPGRGSSRP